MGARATGAEEPHTEELEAYADRVIDCYDEVAPNFKASIIAPRRRSGPYEMEHEYGLIGGNIFHGELSLEQLFHMRPAPGYADYRTPIAGPVQRQLGHPRRRRGLRHPRHAGGPRGHRRPEARQPSGGFGAGQAALTDRRAAVAAMLGARSVAVVGASARPDTFGAGWSPRR